MQVHNLKRNKANRKAKQVGRGGTRGKTSGKGTKGQNARSGRKKRPEMRDIIKRFPKLRGRGKNYLKSIKKKGSVIKTDVLAVFAPNDTITIMSLVEKGLIKTESGHLPNVKIVSGKEISKKIIIQGIPVTARAKAIIEKAGGSVS